MAWSASWRFTRVWLTGLLAAVSTSGNVTGGEVLSERDRGRGGPPTAGTGEPPGSSVRLGFLAPNGGSRQTARGDRPAAPLRGTHEWEKNRAFRRRSVRRTHRAAVRMPARAPDAPHGERTEPASSMRA